MSLVGTRPFILSNLIKQGYPVVPGFVIPASSFWQFLRGIDWSEPLFMDLPESFLYFDINNPRQLQNIAQRIRSHILNTGFSSPWISTLNDAIDQFQASACLFYPRLVAPDLDTCGILDNLSAWTDAESTAMAVKQAWAEIFRARSLFYWRAKNISLQNLKPVVLVQPLTNAIASGGAYLTNSHLEIQANWGLNSSINLTETEPNKYWIDLKTHDIKHYRQGSQTILYRLRSNSDQDHSNLPNFPNHPPIQGEIIDENLQNQWVLTNSHQSLLVTLIKNAIADIGSQWWLDWVMTCNPDTDQPQFQISGIRSLKNISKEALQISRSQSLGDINGSLWGLGVAKGRAVASSYVITDPTTNVNDFAAGSILVLPTITPQWLTLLKQCAGLITEQGGMTSHGAIIARELGIPAVLGVTNATHRISTGQMLVIDGNLGEVRLIHSQNHRLSNSNPDSPTLTSPTHSTHTPLPYPTATQLMVNISQSESISGLSELPVDGVGLVRSELLALDLLSKYPDGFDAGGDLNFEYWLQPEYQQQFIQEMKVSLRQLANILTPRPIFYRSLDLREFNQGIANLKNTPHQQCYKNLYHPLFDLELSLLSELQGEGINNINLLLPYLRSVEEFSTYRHCVEEAGLNQNHQFQLWIMAEVPSVIFQLSDYVKAGVQGITIGTNDLTQLILGINRDRPSPFPELNPSHPAMMIAMEKLIKTANNLKIGTSICGDAPTLYPQIIDSLIQWGIDSISVSIDNIEPTRLAIARAEQRLILAASRR